MANDQLSGRDLDAAVAERVFSWERMPNATALAPYAYKRPDGHVVHPYSAPNYSESIETAMQVVDKMRAQGWSFACTLYEGKLPYASFCKGTAASSRNAEAESLPEAICRAALKAVKSELRP